MNKRSILIVSFNLFDELLNLSFNLLLMDLIENIEKTSINSKDFNIFLSINPLFMSLMNTLNVFNFYLFLSFSVSELDSLVTNLR